MTAAVAMPSIADSVHALIEHEVDVSYELGYAAGRADADAEYVAAIAEALGGTPDYGEAVTRHHADQDRAARRAAFDRGDHAEDSWAAMVAEAARMSKAARERANVWCREPPAWTDWDSVHRDVSPSIWARIWADLSPKSQRKLAHIDPRRQVRR